MAVVQDSSHCQKDVCFPYSWYLQSVYVSSASIFAVQSKMHHCMCIKVRWNIINDKHFQPILTCPIDGHSKPICAFPWSFYIYLHLCLRHQSFPRNHYGKISHLISFSFHILSLFSSHPGPILAESLLEYTWFLLSITIPIPWMLFWASG